MIMHRLVIQAKVGKADDAVARIKESLSQLSEEQLAMFQPRILTDISGSFDTVVVETLHQSLGAYEEFRTAMFARNAESNTDNQMNQYMVSGRNEFYTVEF